MLHLHLLDNPSRQCARLLRRVAGLVLDQLPNENAEFFNSLAWLRQPPGEKPVSWQVVLLQAQVLRGAELVQYLDETLPHERAEIASWVCPLFDVPPEYSIEGGQQPYPLLNFFQQVLGLLGRGELEPDGLAAVIEALWAQFAEGMKRFEQDSDPFRGGKAQKACREVLAALQEMDAFLGDHEKRHLASGAEKFLIACEGLEEVFISSMAWAYGGGPTGVPVLDWSIHGLAAAADAIYPPARLLECLQWARGQLVRTCFEFEMAAASASDPESHVYESLGTCRWALEQSGQALELVLAKPDSARRQNDALPMLLEAGPELAEQMALFGGLAQREGLLNCPRCGSSNPITARICDCGARMPKQMLQQQETGKDAFWRGLLGACEEQLTGEEATATLAEWVRLTRGRQLGAQYLLDQFPTGLELPEHVLKAQRQVAEGVAGLGALVDDLDQYLESRRLTFLSRAIKTVMETAKNLEKVRDLRA
ncbi:MAG: hypothetical protein AB7S38_20295 [Vulcanimicrobiota bacterium]